MNIQENKNNQRYVFLYNGKEVKRTEYFRQAYQTAIMYGNGTFESMEIIDLKTGECICKIINDEISAEPSQ